MHDRVVGVDHQADVVAFLEDQAELHAERSVQTEYGLIGFETSIYEPVVVTKKEGVQIGRHCRIDSFVKLEGGDRLTIGDYVHIASFAHLGIGGGVLDVEDYAAVASGGKVISGSNHFSAPSMSACAPEKDQTVVKSKTRLAKYSFVSTNAVVLPGVTLHEGAVLAAGAVATKDIPAWEIWGGVPARFIAKRIVTSKAVNE